MTGNVHRSLPVGGNPLPRRRERLPFVLWIRRKHYLVMNAYGSKEPKDLRLVTTNSRGSGILRLERHGCMIAQVGGRLKAPV